MTKKEKLEKMSEKEALKMLNELQEKAMKFDEIFTQKLRNIFIGIPSILENSKRIERARSSIYSRKFDEDEIEPFFKELALGLSELTARCRETIGPYIYLDIRGDVADFLAQEGPWGECMGTYYQLDFLFESHPKITQESLGHPNGYKSIIIALIASLKMFNSILPKLTK